MITCALDPVIMYLALVTHPLCLSLYVVAFLIKEAAACFRFCRKFSVNHETSHLSC